MTAADTVETFQLDKSRLKLKVFRDWLTQGGAELLAPTNQWELVRWRDPGGVRVLFVNKKERLTAQGPAAVCLHAFMAARTYPFKQKHQGLARFGGQRLQVVKGALDRDGDDCFFCGQPLRNDITVEHFVPRNAGGPDHIANLVLAHELCNRLAGHMHVRDKLALRDRLTAEAMTAEAFELFHSLRETPCND